MTPIVKLVEAKLDAFGLSRCAPLEVRGSSIERSVCNKILERAEVGKSKYGVTMEREDLSTLEWLVHTQEELMDACIYIQKLIDEKEKEKNRKEVQPIQEEEECWCKTSCSESRIPKWVRTECG